MLLPTRSLVRAPLATGVAPGRLRNQVGSALATPSALGAAIEATGEVPVVLLFLRDGQIHVRAVQATLEVCPGRENGLCTPTCRAGGAPGGTHIRWRGLA